MQYPVDPKKNLTPVGPAVRIAKPAVAKPLPGAPVATTRLNKRMAELGLCSRREADDWIARGWVRVNGQAAVMGQPVALDARIDIDRQAEQQQRQQVTILINKPVGYVSAQAEDGHEPAVVLVQPQNRWAECNSRMRWGHEQLRGLAPAGRLDIDSIGLLVLTQDGRVARQLIGEDSVIEKEYLVRVSYGAETLNVQAAFPPEKTEAAVPRPQPGWTGAAPGAGELAKPRAAALRAARRQEAPDSPHVRAGRPVCDRAQASAYRQRQPRPSAGGSVALSCAARAFLAPGRQAPARAVLRPCAATDGSFAVASAYSGVKGGAGRTAD